MTTTSAFVPSLADGEDERRWDLISDPPHVVSYGDDDFVQLPDEAEITAYVNGVRVIGGLQLIEAGDLVRVIQRGPTGVSYRFAGRPTSRVEPGNGRRCAFTRMPIDGSAVRCGQCDRVVSEKVAQQIGSCVCGTPLAPNSPATPPAEVLL